jgi:hypothetical protein
MRLRKTILPLLSIFLILGSCTSTTPIQPIEPKPIEIDWKTTAEQWKGQYGTVITVSLSPTTAVVEIVPKDTPFPYNTSIGAAALALDLIDPSLGGILTLRIEEGPEYTKGDSYEGWNTVFVFLDEQGEPIAPVYEQLFITGKGIPQEFPPLPEYFSFTNASNVVLTYLDIYTNDMLAVADVVPNLLQDSPLEPGESIHIAFSDYPDLEEAILFRYNQLLHVYCEDNEGRKYYREWYPDSQSLDLSITDSHKIEKPAIPTLAEETIRIHNQSGYTLIDLFILTAEMEEELDFSHEVLAGNYVDDGEIVDIPLAEQAYLESYLSDKDIEEKDLLILAYDEDDYLLLRFFNPYRDGWEIFLGEEDYAE